VSIIVETPLGRFRSVVLDGVHTDDHNGWLWECPGCGAWGHWTKLSGKETSAWTARRHHQDARLDINETHNYGEAYWPCLKTKMC